MELNLTSGGGRNVTRTLAFAGANFFFDEAELKRTDLVAVGLLLRALVDHGLELARPATTVDGVADERPVGIPE